MLSDAQYFETDAYGNFQVYVLVKRGDAPQLFATLTGAQFAASDEGHHDYNWVQDETNGFSWHAGEFSIYQCSIVGM